METHLPSGGRGSVQLIVRGPQTRDGRRLTFPTRSRRYFALQTPRAAVMMMMLRRFLDLRHPFLQSRGLGSEVQTELQLPAIFVFVFAARLRLEGIPSVSINSG